MKVTTEKRPKSVILMDIELDTEQVEKELNRAAKRLSQKYTIPGFRKGKAPRFIIENYLGREALLEEASNDLIDKSFKQALDQENIEPVGQSVIESIDPSETFRFKVAVPVQPTVTISDYRAIRIPLEIEPVTDEMVEHAMDARREQHVVLKELEEPRPAHQGDQLTVKLETFVAGEPLEKFEEGQEIPDTPLVLEPERLVPELYEGLIGVSGDDEREIVADMPEDHDNEQVAGKEVTFKVKVISIQERLLPEWDEVPLLEEVEGDVEALRANTRETLEQRIRTETERELIDEFVDELVEGSEHDIPDAMIRRTAESMLEEMGQQVARYGITLDQLLQYRGQSREEATESMLEAAEDRLKTQLSLWEVVQREKLDIEPDEIQSEFNNVLGELTEEQRQSVTQEMANNLFSNLANTLLNRKLNDRIIAIATGEAPELPAADEPADTAEPDTALPEPAAEPANTADDASSTPDAADEPTANTRSV